MGPSATERKRKPSKKAASPFPDSEFEDSVDGAEAQNPPASKKQRAPKPKKAAAKQAAPAASHDEDEEHESPKKKRKYSPKKGTANHAFLVMLLEAHNQGEEHLTKAELMARADKSGISEKPIYGTEDSVSAAGFPVDGWTNFKTLKKNELVIAEGRPLKVHLTDEGRTVAEGLVAG